MATDQDRKLASDWTFAQRLFAEYDRCKEAGYSELDSRKLVMVKGGASVSLNTVEVLIKAREEYRN